MSDAGVIKVRRKSNIAASRRKLDILVDGKKIGNIANGKEQSFEVGSGRHTVQVKLMSRSELLDIDVSPNGSVELECGVSPQFRKRNLWIVLIALFLIYLSTHCQIGLAVAINATILTMFIIAAIRDLLVYTKPGGTFYLKKMDSEQSCR
jgi:hypothetical protein